MKIKLIIHIKVSRGKDKTISDKNICKARMIWDYLKSITNMKQLDYLYSMLLRKIKKLLTSVPLGCICSILFVAVVIRITIVYNLYIVNVNGLI